MSDFAFRVVFVVAGIVTVSFLAPGCAPSVVCQDDIKVSNADRPMLRCDEGATASFHDTPHGVVLICTCTTEEKKP